MIPASLIPLPVDPEVAARVDALELPFNRYGVDQYGIDKGELAKLFTLIGWFYRRYFEAQVFGAHNVPLAAARCWWATIAAGWRSTA